MKRFIDTLLSFELHYIYFLFFFLSFFFFSLFYKKPVVVINSCTYSATYFGVKLRSLTLQPSASSGTRSSFSFYSFFFFLGGKRSTHFQTSAHPGRAWAVALPRGPLPAPQPFPTHPHHCEGMGGLLHAPRGRMLRPGPGVQGDPRQPRGPSPSPRAARGHGGTRRALFLPLEPRPSHPAAQSWLPPALGERGRGCSVSSPGETAPGQHPHA